MPLLTRLTHEQPGVYLGQLTLAKCELASGNYSAAESALDSALHASPGHLDAVSYKGICLFQENRFKDALPSLQLVEKALPNEPYVHYYLGSIYESDGSAGPALEEFQKCAALDPNFEVAVYKAGFLLAKSGKFAEAIVEFKKVADMDPGNASAHFNLALAYAKSGNESAAQPEFETACKLDATKCLPRDQR
jgi:tetratricopeptide (TPR) repeat protein